MHTNAFIQVQAGPSSKLVPVSYRCQTPARLSFLLGEPTVPTKLPDRVPSLIIFPLTRVRLPTPLYCSAVPHLIHLLGFETHSTRHTIELPATLPRPFTGPGSLPPLVALVRHYLLRFRPPFRHLSINSLTALLPSSGPVLLYDLRRTPPVILISPFG